MKLPKILKICDQSAPREGKGSTLANPGNKNAEKIREEFRISIAASNTLSMLAGNQNSVWREIKIGQVYFPPPLGFG